MWLKVLRPLLTVSATPQLRLRLVYNQSVCQIEQTAQRYDVVLLLLVANEVKVVVTRPLVASHSPHTPVERKVRRDRVPRKRIERPTCHRGELKTGSLFSCLLEIRRFCREVKSSSPPRLPLLQVGRACWNFCKSKWLHLFANKSSPSSLEWSIDPDGARTRDTASIWKAQLVRSCLPQLTWSTVT